jgi:ribosomal protein L11 methylase PrmA
VANILADVIIPLSAVAGEFLKEDGLFITSGIINTKEEEVKEAMIANGHRPCASFRGRSKNHVCRPFAG